MQTDIIRPIQPFFVIHSSQYYKKGSHLPGIGHFYKFRGNPNANHLQAVPDGAVDIIFQCDPDHPSSRICGTVNQGMEAGFESNQTYFGVRILPGIFDHIGEISLKELMQHNGLPAENIFRDASLTERIVEQADFESQIRIFEDSLSRIAHPEENASHLVTAAILRKIYKTAGMIRIQDLSDDLHYSRRHLSRCFEQSTGMDIKTFASYIRFQSVLRRMNNAEFSTLAEAAMAGNYYDQTHFQKNFRQYTGITPGAYLQLLKSVHYYEKLTILK